MFSNQLLKGQLQTIVLQLLTDRGRMYGYEISQAVKSMTAEKIILSEVSLYPTLHKLRAQGLVRTEVLVVGKRRRKYYELTPAGREASVSRVREFFEFVQTMQLLLGGRGKSTDHELA